MAKKKNVTPTRTKRLTAKSPSELIPTPPPSVEEVTLSVDIPTKTGFRLKVALLHIEASGSKLSKKAFVRNAIEEALNRFDEEWGRQRG